MPTNQLLKRITLDPTNLPPETVCAWVALPRLNAFGIAQQRDDQ